MVTETPEILGQYNCSQVAYISLYSCIFIVISVVLWSRVMINLIPPLCLLALFDLASSTTVPIFPSEISYYSDDRVLYCCRIYCLAFQSSSMHFNSTFFWYVLWLWRVLQCPLAICASLVSVGTCFQFYFIHVSAEATSTRSKSLFCSTWNLIRAQKISIRFWVSVSYS